MGREGDILDTERMRKGRKRGMFGKEGKEKYEIGKGRKTRNRKHVREKGGMEGKNGQQRKGGWNEGEGGLVERVGMRKIRKKGKERMREKRKGKNGK